MEFVNSILKNKMKKSMKGGGGETQEGAANAAGTGANADTREGAGNEAGNEKGAGATGEGDAPVNAEREDANKPAPEPANAEGDDANKPAPANAAETGAMTENDLSALATAVPAAAALAGGAAATAPAGGTCKPLCDLTPPAGYKIEWLVCNSDGYVEMKCKPQQTETQDVTQGGSRKNKRSTKRKNRRNSKSRKQQKSRK